MVFTVTLDATQAVLLGAVPAVLVAAWHSDAAADLRPHAAKIGAGVAVVGGAVYFLLSGQKSAARRRSMVQSQLAEARAGADEAREKAENLERELATLRQASGEKPVRIFMEGAFDLMHYGHMNAFRLGQSLGTHLIVGVNSAHETTNGRGITECKGFPPVLTDDERLTAVAGCRFVHDVVPDVPYIMSEKFLTYVIEKYDIDYIVHGDDPCIVDGKDVYQAVKDKGMFKSIPRTEGVSTTDIVGRMLLAGSKDHHVAASPAPGDRPASPSTVAATSSYVPKGGFSSKFMTTSTILRAFSDGMKSPPAGAKIVYVDGAWDMFHAGHIEMLAKAKEHGTYLVVGIFSDAKINKRNGSNYPIMNLNERMLSVMGCKHVDDVLIDAPWVVDEDMIASLKIDVVAHGTVNDTDDGHVDQYRYPREKGICVEVSSPRDLTVNTIVTRIDANRERYEKKFEKKRKEETAYYDARYKRDGAVGAASN